MTATSQGELSGSSASPSPTVELVNVSRWYGNVVAVNDVSFSLGPGITGLLGPNGAGKSTILHMTAGLLRPSKGTVRIAGRPAWRNHEMYRDVGFVPEKETLYAFLTGYQFVLTSAKLFGLSDPAEAARRAIRTADMEAAQDRRLGGYSKGMKQRIKVAAAIVHDPQILLLDEPFSGTDPAQRLQMMELLRHMADEGRTIVFSSHILDEVERLGDHLDQHDWTANILLDGIVVTSILPLVCLILGTSALGSEVEDGTAVYILAKPLRRREIVGAKFAAAALVAAVFVLPATVVSGLIALQGVSEEGIVMGFAIATLLGVFAYTAVFIVLSVATSRALLIGLGYVFIWEGLVTELFTGTRYLSIRQYCLGIADLISTVSKGDFEADLGGPEGLILVAMVAAVALLLAVRRLEAFELTDTD